MEVTLRLGAKGERVVKVEGETPKELFQRMAAAYEVFNEHTCGLCNSSDIRPLHRTAQNYNFYEYECRNCFARLSMGQLQDNNGGLFPVRKLMDNGKPSFKHGSFGTHNGWTQWKGDEDPTGDGVQPKQRQQQPPPQQEQRPQTHTDRISSMIGSMKSAGCNDEVDRDLLVRFLFQDRSVAFENVVMDETGRMLARLESAVVQGWKKHSVNLFAEAKKWNHQTESQEPKQLQAKPAQEELKALLKNAGCATVGEAIACVDFASDGELQMDKTFFHDNDFLCQKAINLVTLSHNTFPPGSLDPLINKVRAEMQRKEQTQHGTV